MIVARESAKHVGFDINGATVAIQGFGNVGSVSADLLITEAGAMIVGVSDWKGGVLQPEGARYSEARSTTSSSTRRLTASPAPTR